MRDRYLIDTSFVQGLLDKNDQHHPWALACLPKVLASKAWITEAVFIEVCAALSVGGRAAAATFIRQCYQTPTIEVVHIDHDLFLRAVSLYESRLDKEWSLVDCMSFVVIQDNRLQYAITTDRHFEQAGFQRVV